MNSLRSGERAQANGAAGVFSKLEGEIREVVSRSATAPRGPQQSANELAAGNVGSLLQHVSGTSVQEIEKLIAELEIVRDTLGKEAGRGQRGIVGYNALIENGRGWIRRLCGRLDFWQGDR